MAETEIPQDVRELAQEIAVSMEVHAAISTTTRAKMEAVEAIILAHRRASRAPDRDALVKGLKWYTNADNGDTLAKSICGTYVVSFCIDDESGEWLTAISPQGDNLGDFATTDLDPAKAVCQSHLAATIRTALAPSVAEPTPPPVAEGMVLTPDPQAKTLVQTWSKFINERPQLLSFLYDVDMMPEQIVSMRGARSLDAVCSLYQAAEEGKIVQRTPNQADGAGETNHDRS